MKTIHDMTHEEKIALTREDLDRLVRQECLRQGVLLLKAPEAPKAPTLKREEIAFQVAGVSYLFTDRTDAEHVSGLLRQMAPRIQEQAYDWRIGHSLEWLKPLSEHQKFEVTEKQYLTEDQARAASAEFKRHEEVKEGHEKARKAYEANQSQVGEIEGDIRHIYAKAIDLQRQADLHRTRFAEYVDLCNGDQQQALVFYRKAIGYVDQDVALLAGLPTEFPAEEAGCPIVEAVSS